MNLEKELKGALVRKINIPHEPNHKWPVEKKIEVVTKYLALGNLKLVAELTGVSYGLIRVWKTYDWWRDLEAEIKATRNIVVGSKLSKIVDKSLEMIGDRLEYGDLVWDKKTGDVNRAPLSVLTVNKIANDMMTRQIEINKLAVVETNSNQQQTVADQLKALAAEFARFNTGRTVDVVAKDVSDAHERALEQDESGGETWLQIENQEASTGQSGILESNEPETLPEMDSGEVLPASVNLSKGNKEVL